MAKRPQSRVVNIDTPNTITLNKAQDFRWIRADSCVPVGSPVDVTIILTRAEPGVLTQTLGVAKETDIHGVSDMQVVKNDVAPIYVQAAHIVLPHDRVAELGGNLLLLIKSLNPSLYEATLERFGFAERVSTIVD